jgi:hypothetical protein
VKGDQAVPDNAESPEQLLHSLRNAQAEKKALQHLLGRATDEIEELVESDCDPAVKEQAAKAAERFRRASEI